MGLAPRPNGPAVSPDLQNWASLALAVVGRAVEDLALTDPTMRAQARGFLLHGCWQSLWGQWLKQLGVTPQALARVVVERPRQRPRFNHEQRVASGRVANAARWAKARAAQEANAPRL